MSDVPGDQTSLHHAAGEKDRTGADWQAAAMTGQPDPLTAALQKLSAAHFHYQVQETVPIVTQELGETPRVSIVHVVRTTPLPKPMFGDQRQDAPEVDVPICSCPHFAHRILPDVDSLKRGQPPLADVLTDDSLRCDHVDTALQHPTVREYVDDTDQRRDTDD